MTDAIQNNNCPSVKSRSETRWSADAAAVKALALGYAFICSTSKDFSEDSLETAEARSTSRGLLKKMCQFERAIMCEIWSTVLQSFNAASISLQAADMELMVAVHLYDGLVAELTGMREQFSMYEERAK